MLTREPNGKRETLKLGLVILLVAASVGPVLGCNTLARQPKFREAAITPAQLKPGDSAVIAVKVADRHKVVDRIVGIVKEDPRIKFQLKDDGVAPDEKAGDGIWTLQVDVPFMAPPGEFALELTAYNQRGDVVMVRAAGDGKAPLASSIKVVIQYPPGQ